MMRVVKFAMGLGVVALLSMVAAQAQGPATLTIHADQPLHKVSPTLYGLMTEEINYSYDGGLYAEMVQDRTFLSARGDTENWVPVAMGNARGSVARDASTGPSAALPASMKITVEQADKANAFGLRDGGWWGVLVKPETTYTGSVWAKADKDGAGAAVKVSLVANDTGKVLATATLPALSGDWKQYSFTMKTGASGEASSANQILVTVDHPGNVWLQVLSVFPPTYKNRANGNRIDLMEKLAAMHPAFLRFPGGNYLEGNTIPDRFDWKRTIGPMVDRPGHASPWRYHSSDGMGLPEFLEWCEDLKMQPVLAVYAGYSLQQQFVKSGPDLVPYVQDALDEIEYVTGDASTKWGAERAKDGHAAPFALNFVEIGNEDQFDRSTSYDGRYAQFYDAIKAKYPALQLIATTPVKGHAMDVLDDHYYKRAEQFFGDTHHYDNADRNGPKIFVGEWATREGTPTPNMGAALGGAAWMTGMERNSDLIVLASYAPLFVNVNPNGMQWQSDLIGYNAASSYGSPSYYAQVLFAGHVGTEVVASELKDAGDRLFYSVTRDPAKGIVTLKLVNASSTAQELRISVDGTKSVGASAKLVQLSAGSTAATNSILDPTRVVPLESTLKGVGKEFTRTLPGYSIEVLEIAAQ
jgi:alpha-N-arabinofuranosidase